MTSGENIPAASASSGTEMSTPNPSATLSPLSDSIPSTTHSSDQSHNQSNAKFTTNARVRGMEQPQSFISRAFGFIMLIWLSNIVFTRFHLELYCYSNVFIPLVHLEVASNGVSKPSIVEIILFACLIVQEAAKVIKYLSANGRATPLSVHRLRVLTGAFLRRCAEMIEPHCECYFCGGPINEPPRLGARDGEYYQQGGEPSVANEQVPDSTETARG